MNGRWTPTGSSWRPAGSPFPRPAATGAASRCSRSWGTPSTSRTRRSRRSTPSPRRSPRWRACRSPCRSWRAMRSAAHRRGEASCSRTGATADQQCWTCRTCWCARAAGRVSSRSGQRSTPKDGSGHCGATGGAHEGGWAWCGTKCPPAWRICEGGSDGWGREPGGDRPPDDGEPEGARVVWVRRSARRIRPDRRLQLPVGLGDGSRGGAGRGARELTRLPHIPSVPLLSFSDVAVEFGATTLLSDVSFTVAAGERWGIVGRNGAGKTTLLRLIDGSLAPTRGAVTREPGLRIALLDQNRAFGGAASVWDAAASGYGSLLELEHDLARQAQRLADLGDAVTEADLTRFGRDQERFAHEGGYQLEARVDAVLQGLGFDPGEARTRPLASLSGGERGRVGLAAQLAAPVDLVLLDEPTNHLDLDTIDWLKRYLGEFGETLIVISHDRAFLDEAVDHVLHVAGRTTTAYRGGYSAFVTQRAERQLALERQVAQQRKIIAKEEEYIRRNIAGQNSAQAKGRRARLARLPRLSAPPGEREAMRVRFADAERGGDQVLVVDRLRVTVGDRTGLQ